jgi:EmrB/QacA subfamily drug resistance transporter
MANSLTSTEHRSTPDWVVLLIACIAQFMVVLDVSIVNVALPAMQKSLHFTLSNAQWVVNAYVLFYAGFLLLGGRAADLFGRRRVYLAGVLTFVIASVGAGIATNATEMIAFRSLQGLGAAILSPASLTLIVTTFRGPSITKAIGAWSAVAGAGGAFGTIFGGLLTGYVNWRWIFFINIPISLTAGIMALRSLQELRKESDKDKLDITGATLVTGGLAAVIYGVVKSVDVGWTASSTLTWIGLGLLALVIFAIWEAKVASFPLVPFRIFRFRSLTTANLTMLLVGGVFFGFWYFLTFYYQYVLGYDAVKTGFAFLPNALAIIVGAQLCSRLLHKFGARTMVFAGSVLSMAGYVWLDKLSVHSSYLTSILPPTVLCTFAVGLLFTPLAQAATAQVDRAESGLASGLLNTSRQVGGSLALAILGTVAADRTAQFANHFSGVALTAGYQRAFAISAAITFVGFSVAFFIPKSAGQHH